MKDILQIHHTARCGSTYLAFVLSEVTTVYSEPIWSTAALRGIDPNIDAEKYHGTVVKFPSMLSCFPLPFNGNKVFLYRPLAQHLCKFKSVEPNWVKQRLPKSKAILAKYKHPKLENFNPTTDIDFIAAIWACSVLRMLEQINVYWVTTNQLLSNRNKVINEICTHFNIPEVKLNTTEFNLDVKKLGVNGSNHPVDLAVKQQLSYVSPVYSYPSYGIIETELAMLDKEISSFVEHMSNLVPELATFML